MELRKDYILNRYVLIANERSKRPNDFVNQANDSKKSHKTSQNKESICFFCPGNEHTTPPEIGRIEEDGKWKIRWFPNKFSAVKPEGNPIIKTDNTYFTFSTPFGYQEVIAETNDHTKQLWDLEIDHIKSILNIYAERINELKNKEHISYVSVFKNHGKEAGTSLLHSHSQIIAYNKLPENIKEKLSAIDKFDHCPYCDIINVEKQSFRRCFENNNFIAFTPYASRFNFEIWVFPKLHLKSITEMQDEQLFDLATILKSILIKLKELNAPYNICLFYSPDESDLHFHIEICPRFSTWAGFEILTNDIINPISPEDAATFYRGEK